MKITKTQLRQIIKEELEAVIKEQLEPDYEGLRRMFFKGGAMPANVGSVRSRQNEKNGTFDMNNGYIGVVYNGDTYQWYGFDADENFDNSVLNGQRLFDAIESYGFRKGSVAIPDSNENLAPLEYRRKHRDATMSDGNLKFPDQHERRGKPAPIYNPNVAPRY